MRQEVRILDAEPAQDDFLPVCAPVPVRVGQAQDVGPLPHQNAFRSANAERQHGHGNHQPIRKCTRDLHTLGPGSIEHQHSITPAAGIKGCSFGVFVAVDGILNCRHRPHAAVVVKGDVHDLAALWLASDQFGGETRGKSKAREFSVWGEDRALALILERLLLVPTPPGHGTRGPRELAQVNVAYLHKRLATTMHLDPDLSVEGDVEFAFDVVQGRDAVDPGSDARANRQNAVGVPFPRQDRGLHLLQVF